MQLMINRDSIKIYWLNQIEGFTSPLKGNYILHLHYLLLWISRRAFQRTRKLFRLRSAYCSFQQALVFLEVDLIYFISLSTRQGHARQLTSLKVQNKQDRSWTGSFFQLKLKFCRYTKAGLLMLSTTSLSPKIFSSPHGNILHTD